MMEGLIRWNIYWPRDSLFGVNPAAWDLQYTRYCGFADKGYCAFRSELLEGTKNGSPVL